MQDACTDRRIPKIHLHIHGLTVCRPSMQCCPASIGALMCCNACSCTCQEDKGSLHAICYLYATLLQDHIRAFHACNISCMCHVMHVSFHACVVSCIYDLMHVSFHACVISCMCHFMRTSFHACVIACMCHFMHVYFHACVMSRMCPFMHVLFHARARCMTCM